MSEPYYSDDHVTIYHGDCSELVTAVPCPDFVIADPPYGISYSITPTIQGKGGRKWRMGGQAPVVGDDELFNPAHLLQFERLVLFGANYYADQLPASGGWVVWDKSDGGRGPTNSFTDVELAWTNVATQPVIFRHLWKGFTRATECGQKVLHPTQKPVALMAWLLERWTEPGDLVLDPYMGSGPVARAAKDLGRRCVGIEIEERYCEIAARRCAQEVLAL